MKFRYYAIFILLVGVGVHFTSCTTQSIPERNLELTSDMNDLIQLEGMNDLTLHVADVYVNFLETLKNNDPKDSIYNSPNGSTLEVEIEGVVLKIEKSERNKHPRNILIDFGTKGIRLRYGNVYTGQILVNETAAMTDTNATRTYIFSNFSINGYPLKGRNSVTHLGQNSDLKPMWKITSKDTLVYPDGRIYSWIAERTRTCLNSQKINIDTDSEENDIDSIRYDTTPFNPKAKSMMLWDNLYSVYGTSNGINTRGNAYSTQVLESQPLSIGQGFPYFISGKKLIKEGKDLLLVDFGDHKKDYWVTSSLHGISLDFNILEEFTSY